MKKQTTCKQSSRPIATTVKTLMIAISSLMAISTTQADVKGKRIGDLEIYSTPTGGGGTVMMVLSNSNFMGSMGVPFDYPNVKRWRDITGAADDRCYYYKQSDTSVNGNVVIKKDDGTDGESFSYIRTYCLADDAADKNPSTATKYFDRNTVLKDALVRFFADPKTYLGDNYLNYKVGLSNYGARGTGEAPGRVVAPAMQLTYDNRKKLLEAIRLMTPEQGAEAMVPALIENAAYMFGTKTAVGSGPGYAQLGYLTNYGKDLYRCPPGTIDKQMSTSASLQMCNNATKVKSYSSAPTVNSASFEADLVEFLGYNTAKDSKSRAGSTSNYIFYHPTNVPTNADGSYNYYSGLDQAGAGTQDTTNAYNYISPLTTTSQCEGYGVYMLTSHGPTTFTQARQNSTTLGSMLSIGNQSLVGNTKIPNKSYTKLGFGSNGQCNSGFTSNNDIAQWKCLGEYSLIMRNKDNPSGKVINTATVGFGRNFSAFDSVTPTMQTFTIDGQSKSKLVYDCNAVGLGVEEKNLCKLGEYGQGYGSGGFYYTKDADDIISSLKQFIGSVSKVIGSSPSGIMMIPNDPYKAIGEMPYAYIPTLEAQVSDSNNSNNIWPGNVKKYKLNDGTLFGKSDSKLFLSVQGDLQPATEDLWSSAFSGTPAKPTNDSVKAGGVYNNLNAPSQTAVNVTRKIFVEDLTASGATTTILRQLSVNSDNKPVGFDDLKDTTVYSRANQIKLLKFMGYEQAMVGTTATSLDTIAAQTGTTATAIKDLVLVAPTSPIKVLGASIHSKPVAVSYGASLDATTGALKQDTRDDYVLFGSMDGALHLVDADDYGTNTGGTEQWAIIPYQMMKNQSDAIVPNAASRPAGVPNFGIDGQWAVDTRYKYDYTNNKVAPDSTVGMSVYGGMRMGGNGLYGINISTKDTPTVKFFKNESRMGQIWNRPTFAKIKTSSSDTTGKRVVIVGGGYDTCYEDEAYQVGATSTSTLKNQNGESCATNTQALGNAIYVLDANDGSVLWSTSSDSSATKANSNMVNSIVASITALDRDNDGFVDQLYAADLGGQLFRIDFKGGVATAATSRVQRILKDEATDKKYVRRFYEQPVVSFYRDDNRNLFAMINVISGDRSSPLSTLRSNNGTDGMNADRLYGIIDKDVTQLDADYYADITKPTALTDIDATKLINIPKALGATPQANKGNIIAAVTSGVYGTTNVYGWYYPLTRFEGYTNVKYTKGIGRSEVIGGLLYTTVYNPDMKYGEDDPCKASIKGGSERQLYCLPSGVCKDETSKNGTGGFLRAGQGLQELALGPRSSKQINQRLLVGTLSMADATKPENRVEFGQDAGKGDSATNPLAKAQGLTQNDQVLGDGTMPGYIFNERYTLTPNKWFEQTK